MSARVLIVGSSGQVATALRQAAWPKGIAIDIRGRELLDLAVPESIFSAVGSDRWSLVINAGAYTNVDHAEEEVDLAFSLNRDGPTVLAKACAMAGIPLIHLSTDYVFDGVKRCAYREDDPVAPLSVYGISKAAGEDGLRACLDDHVILRTSWVFSATGNNFVKTMLRLGMERSELAVVDDQTGCPTSAADIADAVRQIAIALVTQRNRRFGTFHFASPGATTWYGFAQEIFRQAERRGYASRPRLAPITSGEFPSRVRRPASSVLDSSRIREDYGIGARPWRDALSDVLDTLLGPPDCPRA